MKETYVIGVYDLEGNLLTVCSSLTDCSKVTKIQTEVIAKCINDRVAYAKYFQFVKRLNTQRLPQKIGSVYNKLYTNAKPVAKYYNGKLIDVYPSSNEAANRTKIAQGTVATCCNKGYNYLGFEFRYLSDILNHKEDESTRESTITNS